MRRAPCVEHRRNGRRIAAQKIRSPNELLKYNNFIHQ